MAKKTKSRKKSWLAKNKILILGVGNLLFLSLFLLVYLNPLEGLNPSESQRVQCKECPVCEECLPCESINNRLMFGKGYKSEWRVHNYDCGECCYLYDSEMRADYIYAYGCDLTFQLTATPNVNNTLNFKAVNLQESCRDNKVYIDDIYIGDMESCSKHDTTKCLEVEHEGDHVYSFNFVPIRDKIKVKVSPSESCYFGNDLMEAWVST